MYLDYFGFREKPFNVTPDPRFFYNNAVYQETYAGLLYGIRERKGFVSLIGEVGTGKTTLLRKLMAELREPIHFVYVCYTTLTFEELLSFICADLGLQVGEKSHLQRIQMLNEFLVDVAKAGGTGVLLVDEAQNLGDEVLENLRLLSNLETASEKLLQIVLVGQPELERKLAQPKLRQLKQRIAIQGKLGRLKEREVGPFIFSRLTAVGYESQDLFVPEAIRRIAMYSKGTPRLINVICDNALLVAYSLNQQTVSPEIIEEVARDLQLKGDTRVQQRLETEGEGLPWRETSGADTGGQGLTRAASRIASNFPGTSISAAHQQYQLPVAPAQRSILRIFGGALFALFLLGVVSAAFVPGQSLWGVVHRIESFLGLKSREDGIKGPARVEEKDSFAIKNSVTTQTRSDTQRSEESSSLQVVTSGGNSDVGASVSSSSSEATSKVQENSWLGEVPPFAAVPTKKNEETPASREESSARKAPISAGAYTAADLSSPTSNAWKDQPLTIEPGMTVFDLVRKKYGSFNLLAFDLIEESNPHISNLGKIVAGQKIWLPPLTSENLVREDSDGSLRVIAASCRNRREAEEFANEIRKKGYNVTVVQRPVTGTLILQRVEIRQLKDSQDVRKALAFVNTENTLYPTT